MEYITWIENHIELIIKTFISIVLLFPFIKTWKACEDEIKSVKNGVVQYVYFVVLF